MEINSLICRPLHHYSATKYCSPAMQPLYWTACHYTTRFSTRDLAFRSEKCYFNFLSKSLSRWSRSRDFLDFFHLLETHAQLGFGKWVKVSVSRERIQHYSWVDILRVYTELNAEESDGLGIGWIADNKLLPCLMTFLQYCSYLQKMSIGSALKVLSVG